VSGEPLASQFENALDAVVSQFSDQGLTISEALGTLDLVHARIVKRALDSEDEESEP
jgi:hypothetical protein